MTLTKEQIKEFETAAKPLMDFLRKFHPSIIVIVDSDRAEFLEGVALIKND